MVGSRFKGADSRQGPMRVQKGLFVLRALKVVSKGRKSALLELLAGPIEFLRGHYRPSNASMHSQLLILSDLKALNLLLAPTTAMSQYCSL
jgi:hypothetical protein